MITDDLAGILLEHGGSVASEDGRHRECAGCAVVIGLEPRTPRAGMYLAACRELVAAHQAAVVLAHLTAEGWAQGKSEYAVSGAIMHPVPSYDHGAATTLHTKHGMPVVRRYVTDWEPVE